MKKLLIIIFLKVTVLFSLVYPAQNEPFLKLPVRVFSGSRVVGNLTKDDFEVRINGKKKEIVEFLRNNRSLLKVNSPRHFVLAFNITDYGQQIGDGISYFVANILDKGDSLLVLSPVGMHQILTSKDKNDIIETIKEIVKNDTFRYKKDLAHPSATLSEIIKKYHGDLKLGVDSPRTISQFFLSNYSRELKDFMKRFVLPNVMNIRDVAGLLADKEGEKWIINFQEREIIPDFVSYQEVAEQIRETASSLTGNDMANATRMFTVLNVIEKTLLISENLPMKKITDALLGADISYNAILFKGAMKSTTIGDSVAPDLDGTFNHISTLSGGAAVFNSNLSKGLDIIRTRSDSFYELTLKMNAPWEKKAIGIAMAKPGLNAYYKELFTKKEIEAIAEKLKEPGIKLTGFDVRGQSLKFSISGYKPGAPGNKDRGLIRILVELIDETDTVVYKTGKTLSSQKESIDISLELPTKYRGDFKIRIDALDFVSKKSTRLNQHVKL